VNGHPQIPEPFGARWVGDWDQVKGHCGNQFWVRSVGLRTWTVDISPSFPVEVDLIGSQVEDESIGDVTIWVGGANALTTGEALMLASTLARAVDEVERMQAEDVWW
jgi:hypothetical protein